jgi:hypothetical protein
MTGKGQIFIGFFPKPPEPNPFMFKSKEDYFKAREARDELGYSREEWRDISFSNKEITDSDIQRWRQLLDNYNKALNEGLQDRFKQGVA